MSLEAQLVTCCTAAGERFAGVTLPSEAFVAYLGTRLPTEPTDVVAALALLRTNDLFLACACGRGDPQALAVFERDLFGEIDVAAARARLPFAEADDLKQSIRVHLFVARPGARPRIDAYAGRGALRNWLRVLVARAIVNRVTRGQREIATADEVLLSLPLPTTDPEIAYLKTRYLREFEGALAEAIRQLDKRQRTLLRLHFADGLSRDEIGALYGVHRVSAGRWIGEARRALEARVREILKQRFNVDSAELDSILRLVRSQLDFAQSKIK